MVKQYPYTLYVYSNAGTTYNENTGEWTIGEPTWTKFSKCRDEIGGGGKITTADGEVYNYGAVVYMPKGTEGIKNGDRIKVLDEAGNTRLESSVQRFTKDQLHSRLWV